MFMYFLLTLLVLFVPVLHVLNSKYLQRIALFIGASQIALLAFSGKIDDSLSNVMVDGFNLAVSFTHQVVLGKISYLLFTI